MSWLATPVALALIEAMIAILSVDAVRAGLDEDGEAEEGPVPEVVELPEELEGLLLLHPAVMIPATATTARATELPLFRSRASAIAVPPCRRGIPECRNPLWSTGAAVGNAGHRFVCCRARRSYQRLDVGATNVQPGRGSSPTVRDDKVQP
jgi:hypothetical protein